MIPIYDEDWNKIETLNSTNSSATNSTSTGKKDDNSDEYFKATFIYFVLCMIIILFFSVNCPQRIKKCILRKYP